MGGIGSGGARTGAGRKAIEGEPRVKVSMSLPGWLVDLIRAEAVRREVSASKLITELLMKGVES